MSADPVFVDSLPGRRMAAPKAEVRAFAEKLRANPGKWAAYPWSADMPEQQKRCRSSDITCHRYGAPTPLRHGYQAVLREGVIYVRYIGEEL